MDCLTANQKDIVGFLISNGIRPVERRNNGLFFISPFRNEKTPSFKVDQDKNIWYDFGTGTGGRLIDLVCQLHKVNVSTALNIISGTEISPTPFLSFDQQKEKIHSEKVIEIKHIQKLQNKALIDYIESRGIPYNIASMYTEEAYYKTYPGQIKSFFAIAFKNDKGGYELRSNIKSSKFPNGFKGSTSPKTITTIIGNNSKINVFEGFMDFLSALVFFEYEPVNKTIILNSLSHLRQLYEMIPTNACVNLFLDNDLPGKEAAKEITSKYPNAKNQAIKIYPEFKDFNDLICNQYKP